MHGVRNDNIRHLLTLWVIYLGVFIMIIIIIIVVVVDEDYIDNSCCCWW